jgi:HPt (histidine-containing phosphotransfer) domain-containing protein
MDDLSAKFLPQFLELARSRLAAALQSAATRDHLATAATARNLHTLAGEAGLLGLHDVVPLAREGETRAKALGTSRSDADAESLVDVLRRLERVIESIGATYTSK